LPRTFFIAFGTTLGGASDQVQGVGYSESEVEINAAALELKTDVDALELEKDVATLELETEMDVSRKYRRRSGIRLTSSGIR
jgi:hypothetical protein